MLFSLGQIETLLVRQGGVLTAPSPPLATRMLHFICVDPLKYFLNYYY